MVEEDCEMRPAFNVVRPIERRRPPVVKSAETDEEALARNPWFKDARPWLRNAPEVVKAASTVEEAVAIRPPDVSREKMVVEAAFCTCRALPV